MVDTYDPKKHVITFGGKAINAGIVDGTFFSLTRTSPTLSLRGGSDGGQTMVVNNDRSATFEVTYRAGSQTNDVLEDLRQPQDSEPGVYEVGTLLLKDMSGRTVISDENAFITTTPDVEGSQDEPSRTWQLMLPKPTITVRGSLAPPRIGAVSPSV